ncbi:LamB/YcsF family protein [Rothia sp. ZJ932]|uniref:LamB/YcsF family protein n=1 Tax=Rothia sp. ZJ932 TaxID=2810516 RepID=UPI00196776EE|nr:5-oxoprolinase subunit PxpA [Rothia sp. ZJ932]QRZ62663.1 LamB/YcsF family protein [Rothia sp. ZJ932]
MVHIDLNSDSGESFGSWNMGDDAAMMRIVSSANIACGYHAGDPSVMRTTCTAAVANNVTIGAHVAYPDLPGFGRRFIDMTPTELTDAVIYQIGALQAVAALAGGKVSYVKPHGGLYNTIVHHEAQAQAVATAIAELNRASGTNLSLLCLPGSVVVEKSQKAGVEVFYEAFADRGYTSQGTLVSRREADAVIHDPVQVAARVVKMALEKKVIAADGTEVALDAHSVCVHGDTAGAVGIARAVRAALEVEGVQISAFSV